MRSGNWIKVSVKLTKPLAEVTKETTELQVSNWDSLWLNVTQKILKMMSARTHSLFWGQKDNKKQRYCRKLEMQVYSVDRFTQTTCCHVEKGPRSPKVPVFQQELHICMCLKCSKSATAFYNIVLSTMYRTNKKTWQGLLAASPPTLG